MQNRESTEGYSKSIVRKNNDKGLVSTSKTYASPKGTGPGVRRSKCPLSACYTRRKCSMETSQNSVKGRVWYKVWSVGGCHCICKLSQKELQECFIGRGHTCNYPRVTHFWGDIVMPLRFRQSVCVRTP